MHRRLALIALVPLSTGCAQAVIGVLLATSSSSSNRGVDASSWAYVEAAVIASDVERTIIDIAITDLDSDGDADVLIALGEGASGEPPANIVLVEQSGGRFERRSLPATSDTGMAVGDVDGDLDIDVIAGSRLWLNDGLGTLADAGLSLGSTLRKHLIFDLDRDGDLDFAAVDQIDRGHLVVWQNDGDGFTRVTDVEASALVVGDAGVVGADLDADGILELVVSTENSTMRVPAVPAVLIFEQVDRLQFREHPTLRIVDPQPGSSIGGYTVRGLHAGNLDGQGGDDLLLETDSRRSVGAGGVEVWSLREGELRPVNAIVGGWIEAGSMGDVDRDGDDDWVGVTNIRRVRLFLQRYDTTFIETATRDASHSAEALALGDIDGDGDLDAVSAYEGFVRLLILGP
jgi:hypothetical protein